MESSAHIMFVEILPNVVAPIIVEGSVRLGYAIFAVATLSFLGFGIQPPSPDWGLTIASNYGLVGNCYWTVLFDAIAIASLVVGVNLVADGIEHVARMIEADKGPRSGASNVLSSRRGRLKVAYRVGGRLTARCCTP